MGKLSGNLRHTSVFGAKANVSPTREDLCITNPFVGVKIVVGYFVLGENEPSLLVVQRRGLLLLLRPLDEDFFQYVV